MPSDGGSLRGRHAVVTGGVRGIGAGIARALRDAGASVSVASRSRPDDALDDWFEIDVADSSSVDRTLQQCRERNGPIAILVNNAGVAESASIARTTDELWHRAIATNLDGAFYCSRAVAGEMLVAGWGRIV